MSTLEINTAPDPREERGQRIAMRHHLRPRGDVWLVPSESSTARYHVDPKAGRCTCPDNELRRHKCKHLFAVEYTIRCETTRREKTTVGDGVATKTVITTVRTTKTARVTYAQNWPTYNDVQSNEKAPSLHRKPSGEKAFCAKPCTTVGSGRPLLALPVSEWRRRSRSRLHT